MGMEERQEVAAGTVAGAAVSGPVADSPRRHLWGDEPQESVAAQFLDNLYGVLFSPRATFEDLAHKPPLGMALVLYLLILAVDVVAGMPSLTGVLNRLPFGRMMATAAGIMTPVYLLLTVVSWLVLAAILHLVAEWLGGHGRATDLFILGAFYRVPQLFAAPVALVASLFWPALTTPFSLLLAVWGVVLEVFALRANYRVSTGSAVLILVLPIVAAIVVAVVFGVSAAAVVAPFLRGGLR